MIVIVPVEVCLKRYYRTYVEVDENATEEDIRREACKHIVSHQEEVLIEDPCMDIEEGDIEYLAPDIDGAWTKSEDDDEIARLLREMEESHGEVQDETVEVRHAHHALRSAL